MRLLAMGVDHRSAPASVREALAFDGTQCAAGLDLLARTFPGNELVILSTCNRVELYVAGSRGAGPGGRRPGRCPDRVPRGRRRGGRRAPGQLPR